MAFSNKQQINTIENSVQSLLETIETKQNTLNTNSNILLKSLNVDTLVVAGESALPIKDSGEIVKTQVIYKS